MELFFHRFSNPSSQKNKVPHLAFFWVLGLVLGVLSCRFIPRSFSGFMLEASSVSPSFPGSVLCAVVPVLISWFAYRFCSYFLLFPVVFLSAFILAFYSVAMLAAFGAGGWLVHLLYFFSIIVRALVCWVCWILLLSKEAHYRFFLFPVILLICTLIGIIDYVWVSPFLQKILF